MYAVFVIDIRCAEHFVDLGAYVVQHRASAFDDLT